MVDIHCHLLYDVDDGADTLKESLEMLREACRQGVRAIILTPHYRHGMFYFDKAVIEENFAVLKPYAKKLGMKLYLGTEYHIDSNCVKYLQNGRCLTLADSPYVLSEFSYGTEYSYIRIMVQELLVNGYLPVIAHAERYRCMREHPEYAGELQKLGAWIQVNADAVLGLEGWKTKRYVKKLLKNDWVDIVASDSHNIVNRECRLGKCRKYLKRKYGEKCAVTLLEKNPEKILRARENR